MRPTFLGAVLLCSLYFSGPDVKVNTSQVPTPEGGTEEDEIMVLPPPKRKEKKKQTKT